MAPKCRILAAATKADRAAARQAVGSLRNLFVSPHTLLYRYKPACAAFFAWLAAEQQCLAPTVVGIDIQVASYISFLWDEGEGRNAAGDILSGLSHYCPHLKGNLKGGWQLFKAWSRQELPNRAPPLPEIWVWAMAAMSVRNQQHDVAALLIIAFYGLLRTMEAATLLAGDCCPTASGEKWVLNLGLTKGGQRRGVVESVVVTHPLACAFLKAATQDQPKGSYLLRRPVAQFRKIFKTLCFQCGLSRFNLQPYSLRRGGATSHFNKVGSFDAVSELGRWNSATTAKIYINEGLATLNELTLCDSHAHLISRLADELFALTKVTRPTPAGS